MLCTSSHVLYLGPCTYPINWLWKWPFSCLHPWPPTLLDYSLGHISCYNGPITRKASGAHFPIVALILCLCLQVWGMTCLPNACLILLGPLTCVWISCALHLSLSSRSTPLLWLGSCMPHTSPHTWTPSCLYTCSLPPLLCMAVSLPCSGS